MTQDASSMLRGVRCALDLRGSAHVLAGRACRIVPSGSSPRHRMVGALVKRLGDAERRAR